MSYLHKPSGYLIANAPNHPLAGKNGRVREHRMIWFDANGAIPDGFEIHHRNGVRTDNRLENLELIAVSEHRRQHYLLNTGVKTHGGWNKGVLRAERINLKCDICGSVFQRLPGEIARAKRRGHTIQCCSMKCATKHASSIRLRANGYEVSE